MQLIGKNISPFLKYGVLIAAFIIVYSVLPIEQWVASFQGWVIDQGPTGWVLSVLGYALATVLLAPGAVLTIAAGVAYGLWAFPIVVIGATLGAGGAFLCGRYIARKKVRGAIKSRPKFKAVDAAIRAEGWKVVALMRLSPAVPFNLQNWFFGATAVGFWPYILATFFGIMPGTLLYVWIGSLGGSVGEDASTAKYILFTIGILATLVVTIYISKKARIKLQNYQ